MKNMGHATFHVDADNLTELLRKLRETWEKHPTMEIEEATFTFKTEKGYHSVGSCGLDLAIDRTYSKPPKKNLRLTLRVLP
jgi:hypothetical protein